VTSELYDDFWQLVPDGAGEPPREKVEFVRDLGPVERALDLGCGDGSLTSQLAADELTAADISVVALKRARTRLSGARLVALEPAGPLPFEDASFDLVLCADTLQHVPDLRRLFPELKRVLAPFGTLAVTVPLHDRQTALDLLRKGFDEEFDPLAPPVHRFTPTSLRRVMSLAGLEPREMTTSGRTIFALADR
jgi:ubiquinone/menaquinone biosynthesis C-methylase UbiE